MHNRVHIGFDISQTGSNKTGCGYFAHAMIQALFEQAPNYHYSLFPSFGNFYFDKNMPLLSPYPLGDYGPCHSNYQIASEFWLSDNVENLLKTPDIIHANNFWCPNQLKVSRLIYTLYDMSFLVEPAWTTEANRIGCFEGAFRASMCADWIIAISAASKAHYLTVFPHYPEERIRVIYPCSRFNDDSLQGIRTQHLKNLTAGQFWLNVGTIEPRKNQLLLAEAYAQYMAKEANPMPLVLAGGNGWLMNDFKNHLRKLKIDSQVIFTGYVSDEELIWLYRNCYANLYPSLFEGFGLPVLEGMQFGAPSLISNVSSMPEITGEAAMLLSPKDKNEWANAMSRLAHDRVERDRLSKAAIEQARQFCWKQSARQLIDLYNQALHLPKKVNYA